VGLDNLVAITGFKDFLRLFVCLSDHGNALDQMLSFVF
jgi:hypothetical protein